ncbi:hypothetical protein [Pararhodonellum marinum]|uniref:hypothetical protein n=1 Tax=Pararhodonellum marinum TaxID=2755358 RepID=UPI00188EBCAE|nr:hypothetical protein [Pararhodonellum marinum]
MKKIYFLLCLVFLFSSCMEEEPFTMGDEEFLVGQWTNLKYSESGFTMEKTSQIPENTYGFIIRGDGTLIHRSNLGFCGTPPIITQDYPGRWEVIGDIIQLESEFWGGTHFQEWKVTFLGKNQVQIEWITNEYNYED